MTIKKVCKGHIYIYICVCTYEEASLFWILVQLTLFISYKNLRFTVAPSDFVIKLRGFDSLIKHAQVSVTQVLKIHITIIITDKTHLSMSDRPWNQENEATPGTNSQLTFAFPDINSGLVKSTGNNSSKNSVQTIRINAMIIKGNILLLHLILELFIMLWQKSWGVNVS